MVKIVEAKRKNVCQQLDRRILNEAVAKDPSCVPVEDHQPPFLYRLPSSPSTFSAFSSSAEAFKKLSLSKSVA